MKISFKYLKKLSLFGIEGSQRQNHWEHATYGYWPCFVKKSKYDTERVNVLNRQIFQIVNFQHFIFNIFSLVIFISWLLTIVFSTESYKKGIQDENCTLEVPMSTFLPLFHTNLDKCLPDIATLSANQRHPTILVEKSENCNFYKTHQYSYERFFSYILNCMLTKIRLTLHVAMHKICNK